MSETATAQPNADIGFADALDAGIQGLDNPTPEAPIQPAQEVSKPAEVAQKPVAEKVAPAVESNPLDVLTKRLTGQEEAAKDKTAPADDLDIKTPENLKPEAQTAWARLTKDLRDARTKLKELEAKTAQAPANSVEQVDLKAQLDALKQERDEYESELRFARLESTKEYKQAVTEPLSVIQKEVADIAGIYEADPRAIYSAMVEPDAAKRRALLKEATANFDPVDSLAVRAKAEELQKVFERRDILTKDVKTVLEMLENEERTEMETFQKRSQEELTTAYKTEWENMQKENPLLRPIEDNEAWNNTLKTIESKALEIENTELDPRSKARLTFNAAAMPVVMQLFQDYVSKTQTRISELEKTAKELRSTIPSVGAETGSAPEIAADLGFLDALERGLGKK
jgi:hypothetical protein